ncbi:hypothetical protein THAOC_16785, partial [Thalassiosira oceanica]
TVSTSGLLASSTLGALHLSSPGFSRYVQYAARHDSRGGTLASDSSNRDDDDEPDQQFAQEMKLLADSLLDGSKGARYAIKSLDVESLDENSLIRGMIDIAWETDALSSCSHAHIIKIWAIGSSGKYTPDHFAVIDRLYDTLEERIIATWAKKKTNEESSFRGKVMNWRSGEFNVLMKEKLRCAHDIATALEHLHENKVVFRNLKPSKCSFNIWGDIVLSDMGLSRDTRNASKVTDETFKLTGNTGSLCLMAPEVSLNEVNESYGFSADMHSFGLTLWQILKMEVPFHTISHITVFVNMVVKKGARPKVEKSREGPHALADVLKSCWHNDLTKRPTVTQCVSTLRQELNKCRTYHTSHVRVALDNTSMTSTQEEQLAA